MTIDTNDGRRSRAVATLALMSTALIGSFGANAGEPDAFEAEFRAAAAEATANFKQELVLALETSVRPVALLDQDRVVATTEAMAKTDQEKAGGAS